MVALPDEGRSVQYFLVSITKGHATIGDMNRLSGNEVRSEFLDPWLAELNALPFVSDATCFQEQQSLGHFSFDAIVRIETPVGICDYLIEVKRSYLDTSVTRHVQAVAEEVARQGGKMLLLARYLPLPTARQLMEAGVAFVDMAGNIHLNLAPNYHWAVVGNRERVFVNSPPVRTPSTLQVFFAMAANSKAERWTVRKLAAQAGVSKSKAAKTLSDCLQERMIHDLGDRFQISNPHHLADDLLSGYRQILRPRLTIGRFRSPQRTTEEFLAQLRETAHSGGFRAALSGGHAAYRLQGLYSERVVTVFVERSSEELCKTLRLLPDREGPITLLKGFGEVAFWRKIDDLYLAHPWLVYAELMFGRDPRSQKAAEELRKEFLVS